MLAESEEAFQTKLLLGARFLGWRDYHTHDSRRSKAGFPDLTLTRGVRLIFAELKADAEQRRATLADVAARPEWLRSRSITNEQAAWLMALAATPAEVYVWRPADWDQIMKVLK